jgi:putative membrane protein
VRRDSDDRSFYVEWRGPDRRDFALPGLAVRFVTNVAALWFAQFVIRGFDVESAGALIFGAIIFGAVNALIRPIIAIVSCPLTILTLGLFTLIVNTLMLALTAWIAGLFDSGFHVDGFIAAFLGALVISIVSTVLSWWARRNVLEPIARERSGRS